MSTNFRTARAAIFAIVCVTLATVGHAVAGETSVAPWAFVVGLGGTTLFAWVLAGAERSLVTIMGGMLGGQFVLHSLFMSARPGPAMDHATGRVVGAMPVHQGHGGLAMTLAHAGAAVISAWWLRRGERAVWRLARRTVAPVRALLALLASRPVTVPAVPVLARTPEKARRPARTALLRHSVIRRGPPPVSTVVA
jgi:hypothetical protein